MARRPIGMATRPIPKPFRARHTWNRRGAAAKGTVPCLTRQGPFPAPRRSCSPWRKRSHQIEEGHERTRGSHTRSSAGC